MKLISTKAHGVGDYLGAVILFFAPELFGFSAFGGAAVAIPRILAIIMLAQALFTNYELSPIHLIPMRVHLSSDVVLGLFLAGSPWLFGFHVAAPNVWLPHFVVGLAIVGFGLATDPIPYRSEAPRADRMGQPNAGHRRASAGHPGGSRI